MEEQTQHQVMTEVALALAMVFFCIMVVTLISVGMSGQQPELIQISQSKVTENSSPIGDGTWVIFHAGKFYDQKLQRLDPMQLQEGSIWLAVAADLSLQQLISAKSQISSSDISIALLDQRWLTRLEELP